MKRRGRHRRRLKFNLRLLFVLIFLALSVSSIEHNIVIQNNQIEKTESFFKCSESINQYIKKNYPKSKITGEFLLKECYKYDIDPVFVLAQGILESGLGTQGSSKITNNVWSVGHSDGKTTKDVMRSKYHYKNPNLSLEPYLKLLRRKYLGKYKTEKQLLNNYVTLGGKRYASNPQYEVQLRTMYNKILKKTNIDELWDKLKEENL